jgi:hypothetical protein
MLLVIVLPELRRRRLDRSAAGLSALDSPRRLARILAKAGFEAASRVIVLLSVSSPCKLLKNSTKLLKKFEAKLYAAKKLELG